MAAKLTPITGQVLDHALQDAQISRRDAADRLGVSVADLDAWIRETRAPNAGQFGYGHLYDEHGEAMSLMRSIKKALDPDNIMNPGKIMGPIN